MSGHFSGHQSYTNRTMEKRWDLMENFGVSLSPLWECWAVGGLVVLVLFFGFFFFMPATFLFLCLRFVSLIHFFLTPKPGNSMMLKIRDLRPFNPTLKGIGSDQFPPRWFNRLHLRAPNSTTRPVSRFSPRELFVGRKRKWGKLETRHGIKRKKFTKSVVIHCSFSNLPRFSIPYITSRLVP